jgi:hypothetical protein
VIDGSRRIGDVTTLLAELRTGVEALSLLGLAGVVERISELAARPELEGITALEVEGMIPNWRHLAPPSEALGALAAAPALSRVRSLTLRTNALDDKGALALAGAPWLRTVEELVLVDHPALGAQGFTALVGRLPALKRLWMDRCEVGPPGARALAAAESRLDELGLRDCRIDEEGARAIFASPLVAGARRVVVQNDDLGDALAAFTPTTALTYLELTHCRLTGRGAAQFASGGLHSALTLADLSHNSLDDQAALAFATSTAFPALARLDLRGNAIGTRGAAALCAPLAMPALAWLGLSDNAMPTGVETAHTWDAGMWEGGSVVVGEAMSATQLEQAFVRKARLQVF